MVTLWTVSILAMAKKSKKRLSERLNNALNDIVAKQLITIDYPCFERHGDVITSQGTREALNRSDIEKTYVKATHWFGIFWYYVNIQVRKDTDGVTEVPFVSISFFQEEGEEIKQLFRAEWDNYKQKSHPQPHWHITLEKEIGFDDIKEEVAVDCDSPFAELENEERALFLPKMHFAMAGDWHKEERDNMINGYTDVAQLSKWLINLFDHVHDELEYAY